MQSSLAEQSASVVDLWTESFLHQSMPRCLWRLAHCSREMASNVAHHSTCFLGFVCAIGSIFGVTVMQLDVENRPSAEMEKIIDLFVQLCVHKKTFKFQILSEPQWALIGPMPSLAQVDNIHIEPGSIMLANLTMWMLWFWHISSHFRGTVCQSLEVLRHNLCVRFQDLWSTAILMWDFRPIPQQKGLPALGLTS